MRANLINSLALGLACNQEPRNAAVKIPRDDLILKLAESGIETRPVFYPMHIMPPYKHEKYQGKFPNSTHIAENGLCLPSHARLSAEDVKYIVAKLVEYCK